MYPLVKENAQHLANATFVSFPELGHPEVYRRADLALPHVMKFLRENRGV